MLGTAVVPARAHAVERLHWRVTNGVRRLESLRGAASLVAGPCYAFRRALLDQLPADVVADDARVALAAAAAAGRVVIADVCVTERRSPTRTRSCCATTRSRRVSARDLRLPAAGSAG